MEEKRGMILRFSETLSKSGRLCIAFHGQKILPIFQCSVSGF